MTRLRIDFASPPFSGHLHPILGLARRLAREHEVRVLSTERVQGDIAAAGLEGVVVLPGGDAAISAISDPARPVRSDPFQLHAQLRANLRLLARLQGELRGLWGREGRRPDLVIADLTVPIAGAVARELGIPWWTTHPSPCVVEAPDGPPAYLGGLRPARGPLGRLRDALGRTAIHAFKRSLHRFYRKPIAGFGFPRLYREDGSEAVYSDEKILGLSVPELEFPRAWPRAVELIGPVSYTPPAPAAVPPPFVAGRAHVLVTIGTHLGFRKDELAAACAGAARRLPGVEIHFSDGDARGSRRDDPSAPANFHRLPFVPYDPFLPRYRLVVHHAGTGVLFHTLRAGLPAVVHPLDYDQFDYAARLESAGLALRLRRFGDLAARIAEALADTGLEERCGRFREILGGYHAEETVAERVRALALRDPAPLSPPAP